MFLALVSYAKMEEGFMTCIVASHQEAIDSFSCPVITFNVTRMNLFNFGADLNGKVDTLIILPICKDSEDV